IANDIVLGILHFWRVTRTSPTTRHGISMNLLGLRRGEPSAALPPRIYVALVDSLFQNYLASFAGTVCAAIAALLTAWKTGTVLLWPCAIFIILVGAARAYDMYAYESCKSQLTPETAVQWERRYRIGAWLYARAVRIWW